MKVKAWFRIIGTAIISEIRKGLTMLDIRLIERGLEKPGKTKGGLAAAMGVRPGAVSEILSGLRLIKASEIAPIIEYLELNSVPIMGRVGAGASIAQGDKGSGWPRAGQIAIAVAIAESTDSADDRGRLSFFTTRFLFFRIFT